MPPAYIMTYHGRDTSRPYRPSHFNTDLQNRYNQNHQQTSERKTILAKVMIVDDDRTMTSLMQTLLELDGYEVIVVSRGKEVIARAEQTRPDIIVMDYHLSDVHGVDIVKDIRAHSTLSGTPIIIASGMDVSDEVLAAGANEFLTKPFEPDDLPIIFKRHNVV